MNTCLIISFINFFSKTALFFFDNRVGSYLYLNCFNKKKTQKGEHTLLRATWSETDWCCSRATFCTIITRITKHLLITPLLTHLGITRWLIYFLYRTSKFANVFYGASFMEQELSHNQAHGSQFLMLQLNIFKISIERKCKINKDNKSFKVPKRRYEFAEVTYKTFIKYFGDVLSQNQLRWKLRNKWVGLYLTSFYKFAG